MNQSITKIWSQHNPQSAESSPKHTLSADSNSNIIPLTSKRSIPIVDKSQDEKEKFKNTRKSKIKVSKTDFKNLKSRQFNQLIYKKVKITSC
jgi:hypothetical protein